MSAPPGVDTGTPAEAAPRPRNALARLRMDRSARTAAVATVLGAGHLLLRAWVAAGGWLTRQDYVAAAHAYGLPVHVSGPPGAVAVAEVVASVAPLSWPALVGLELVAQLVVDVSLYRVLVGLFGRRPAVLLPLTVYVASSLPLVGGVWWSAALVQLPLQLALLAAVSGYLRHARTGARAPLATAAVAVAVGLLFGLQAVVVPVVLFVGTALWGSAGPLRNRLRAIGRLRAFWAAQAAAVAAGVAARLVLPGDPLVDGAALGHGLRALPETLTRTVLPGLLGGPWRWRPVVAPLAVPAPSDAMVLFATIACCGVVLGTLLVHRGALRAWLVAAAAVVVTVLADAASPTTGMPAGVVPPAAVALLAALGLGLASLPVRGAPPVLRRRTFGAGGVPRPMGRATLVGAGVVAAAALLVGDMLSTTGFARHWSTNAGAAFVAHARADLTGRTDLAVADTPVPDDVVPAELAPANRASVVLAGLPRLAPFLQTGQIVYQLTALDAHGHGQLATVDAVTRSGTGPAPDCGWLAGADPAEIPLPRATADGRWIVQISYFAGTSNGVRVTAGDTVGGIVADAGPHYLFLQADGPVRRVTVQVVEPQFPICVTEVAVGRPRPVAPAGG